MNPNPILITASLFAGDVCLLQAATVWNASADFVANETPDVPTPGSTELSNPNAEFPEWRYGFRDVVASTSLTLFATGQHNNSIAGNPNFQGWENSFLITAANTSGGISGGLNPGDLLVHPMDAASSFTFNVIRWTAPAPGIYDISASWHAASTEVGVGLDGTDSHIVKNGTAIFNGIVAPGQTVTDTRSLSLVFGDFIDFVVGPGASGTNTNDSTIFFATITLVPEPSSAILATAALPILLRRRRRS